MATYKGATGAMKTYKEENAKLSGINENKTPLMKGPDPFELEMKKLDFPGQGEKPEYHVEELDDAASRLRNEAIQKMSATESDIFPWNKMKLVIYAFIITVITPYLLGGKGQASIFGIEKCSVTYYLGSAVYFAIVIYLWYKAFQLISEEEHLHSVIATNSQNRSTAK